MITKETILLHEGRTMKIVLPFLYAKLGKFRLAELRWIRY